MLASFLSINHQQTVQPYANLMSMPTLPGRVVHRVKDKVFDKNDQLVSRTELYHGSSEASTDIISKESTFLLLFERTIIYPFQR